MPAAPNRRSHRGLYQPPLPLAADPGLRGVRQRRPEGGAGQKAATNGRRITTGPRPPAAGTSTSPPPAPDRDPSWRLDEKTRRAGRLGVAAARAALAGTAPDEQGRRADAA